MLGRRRMLAVAAAAAAAVVFVSVGPVPAGAEEKPAPAQTSAVGGSPAADQDTRAPAAAPAATVGALRALQTRVADYVARGARYSFGDYVDPDTGRIVLETDAPADVVSSLLALPGAAPAQQQAAAQAEIRHTGISASYSRRDDVPPFFGGGGITNGAFTCSSGYAVQNSAGTVFSVTAGHCFAEEDTVTTESGARTYGTVSNRHLSPISGDQRDMELIGGQSYSGRVFTGGVDSSTSVPVYGAGSAAVGFSNYCHSGRTTGENCGHTAVSIDGQVCYTLTPPMPNACIQPAIKFTGGTLSDHGDSGGPFYVYSNDNTGVHIRGNVVAGANDRSASWAQPWPEVASTLGVSIVTTTG